MRIHPWDLCFDDRVRKGSEPSLRLPLFRIRAPNTWIDVRVDERQKNPGAVGYENLRDFLTILSDDGFGEWQDDVFVSPAQAVSLPLGREGNWLLTLVLGTEPENI